MLVVRERINFDDVACVSIVEKDLVLQVLQHYLDIVYISRNWEDDPDWESYYIVRNFLYEVLLIEVGGNIVDV